MALTIRKKKSGLIIPTIPKLIIPTAASVFGNSKKATSIETEIKRIVEESIAVSTSKDVRHIMFIPIYSRVRGEKEISRIYLKFCNTGIEKVLESKDIEDRGVELLEFFDYIISNGAIELQDPKKALEIM
tara:strand:- start:252 stop:641 length:390 start_codon:yes stop_codon:yes gene_type:complete